MDFVALKKLIGSDPTRLIKTMLAINQSSWLLAVPKSLERQSILHSGVNEHSMLTDVSPSVDNTMVPLRSVAYFASRVGSSRLTLKMFPLLKPQWNECSRVVTVSPS